MKKRRSNQSFGTVPILLTFLFLLQGCNAPFGVDNLLRDHVDDADARLVISDDGAVFASGRVETVAERSFELAGAAFDVSNSTSFLDRDGRAISLPQVEVGDLLEVDGVQLGDGSLKATFAEVVDDGEDQAAEQVVICHKPPGNPENGRTKSIGAPAVDAHLAHGDHVGECTSEETGSSDDEGDEEEDDADEDGEDNEEKVIVCHIPPGHPDDARTLEIGLSSLQNHLDHGDYEGECIVEG